MTRRATIKNWAEFQHYKDRNPPWVKLHRKLLDDFKFSKLPIASKALAPMLWLLAAETMDGSITVDEEELAHRLRWKLPDVKAGLSPLIQMGFLILASKPLSKCEQVDTPETEAETNKTEKALVPAARTESFFEAFWKAFPARPGKAKVGKKPCAAKWKARNLDAIGEQIIANVEWQKKFNKEWVEGYCPNPETYINQDRWADGTELGPEGGQPTAHPIGASPPVVHTVESKLQADIDWINHQVHLCVMSPMQAKIEIAKLKGESQ